MSLTLTIGRNIGNEPMPEDQWQRFTQELVRIARAFTGNIYFVGFGTGIYEGTEEESFTLVSESVSYAVRERMEDSISRLAHRYSQECIAFTDGRTHLLGANLPV